MPPTPMDARTMGGRTATGYEILRVTVDQVHSRVDVDVVYFSDEGAQVFRQVVSFPPEGFPIQGLLAVAVTRLQTTNAVG